VGGVIHYKGLSRLFKILYWVPDPFRMKKNVAYWQSMAQYFKQKKRFLGTVLDVGCGEGLFYPYIEDYCQSIEGVDVSYFAIRRARIHYPKGQFKVADLMQLSLPEKNKKYDTVLLMNVIYYLDSKKFDSVIDQLNRLGNYVYVVYYEGEADCLNAYFISKKIQVEKIDVEKTVHYIASWPCDKVQEPESLYR